MKDFEALTNASRLKKGVSRIDGKDAVVELVKNRLAKARSV